MKGAGSISISSLKAGSHPITAMYQGSPKFKPSFSTPLPQVVNLANTVTSIRAFPDPVAQNQNVVYSAKVAGQYNAAAGGTITFKDGGTAIATVPLKAPIHPQQVQQEVALYLTSYSAIGAHLITATYSGDSNNHGSTSSVLTEYVRNTTSTSLATSGSPTLVGQRVTLTASVTSGFGAIPDGELVTFYDRATALASVSLKGGVATYTTASLSAGTHSLKAVFGGDEMFAASSGPLTQVVNAYATSTTLASSLNPSIYGEAVTFTAKVTTTGPVRPSGMVAFIWSGHMLGSATLNASGVAMLSLPSINAAPYPLTAAYMGDANNQASGSAVLNQVVEQTTSQATITSAPNPSSVGQAVTFTARVTSPTVIPKGPVTFTAGTNVLGTAQLSAGRATFSTSSLPGGSVAVKVTYAGDSNIKGSSATLTQAVQP